MIRGVSGRLNIDVGELADEPEALYGLAHEVNIACGGHAGDEASMRRALIACARHGTAAGAHPGYEDRAHFGRRSLDLDERALEESVHGQCARLGALGRTLGVPIVHAKLHGALYHDAGRDEAKATACVRGIVRALGPVRVLGLERSVLPAVAAAHGCRFGREGFADRGLRPDGSLVPRGAPGALLHDPAQAAAQALRLAPEVDTLCVHGDSPGAADIARAVRSALDGAAPTGPVIEPLGDRALRFLRPAGIDPTALLQRLRGLDRVFDAHLTETHACLSFDGRAPDLEAGVFDGLPMQPQAVPRTHVVGVVYDGPDLDDVAAMLGCTRAEVIRLHAAGTYVARFVGFAPGFAYLRGLDPALSAVPRRPRPRPRVDAGAVAIAGGFSAVYPFPTAGGWNLLGRAPGFVPFDGERALISAGDVVRFEALR